MKELWAFFDATGVLALILGGLWAAHKAREFLAGRSAKREGGSQSRDSGLTFPRLHPGQSRASHILGADLGDVTARTEASDP